MQVEQESGPYIFTDSFLSLLCTSFLFHLFHRTVLLQQQQDDNQILGVKWVVR